MTVTYFKITKRNLLLQKILNDVKTQRHTNVFSNIRILFFKIFQGAIFIHNFAYLYFHAGLFRLRLCPFYTDVSFLSYTDFAALVVRTPGPKCRPGLQKENAQHVYRLAAEHYLRRCGRETKTTVGMLPGRSAIPSSNR
jgi:hypothetical protein